MAFDTEELMRRALALHQSGDHAGAAELYRSILDGVPGHPGANHFYGLLLHQRGDNAAALEHMTRSLKGGPPTPAFLANIGGVHADEWRLDEAEDFYKKALRLSPSMPEALLGAGLVAQKRGDCGRAEDFYRRALKTDPNSAQAHWNLALLLLLTGRYEEGWREHEWRFHGKSNWRFPPPDVAALRAARRPSALVNEMGLGDVIQFMRFFPVARGLWPELDLKYVCMPSLSRLFMDSFGRNLMVAEGAVLDGGVEPIPLLSMPFLLGLSPEAVDGRPYLRAGDRAVQSWGRDMEADAGPRSLKVGLAWAGSPTHRNDRVRSIPLSRLSRILEIPGVSFFSLQRGHGAEQLLSIPENLRPFDYGSRTETFADLAGVMANLDVVVSVDTAPLHLAGALGVKTYGLIQFSPDWRWGLGGERIRWYDSVTLLRQERLFDWEPCLSRLESLLREEASPKRPGSVPLHR